MEKKRPFTSSGSGSTALDIKRRRYVSNVSNFTHRAIASNRYTLSNALNANSCAQFATAVPCEDIREKIFQKYKQKNQADVEFSEGNFEVIGIDGIQQLARDMGIGDSELVWFVIVLSFFMEAANFGMVSKHEFIVGLKKLSVESFEGLYKKIEYIRQESGRRIDEIFDYAFKVAKGTPVQRVIKLDIALNLIEALLPHMVHTHHFLEFLRNSKYHVLNGDQWRMFLLFNRVVGPDFLEYSIDGAWPVMIDEFVEYVRAKKKKKIKWILFKHIPKQKSIRRQEEKLTTKRKKSF